LTLIEAQASGLPCLVAEHTAHEADLTDLLCRLSLEPSRWVSRVKSAEILDDTRRHAYCQIVKNTEYGLENAVGKLLTIYQTDHSDGEKD
jgi:hypothetical protein